MDVKCKECVRLGKHIFAEGDVCQAILTEKRKEAVIYIRTKRVAQIPFKQFNKYFVEVQ